MRKIVILLSMLVVSLQALDSKHHKIVKTAIDAFKAKDKQTIVKLLSYPIRRSYPIPEIKNKEEMLVRFDQVFDEKLVQAVGASDIEKDQASCYVLKP